MKNDNDPWCVLAPISQLTCQKFKSRNNLEILRTSRFSNCLYFLNLRMIRWRYWWNTKIYRVSQKLHLLSSFEFLTLGGVFTGVKNNSKNFGNKKNIRLFSKILSKWTLLYSKSSNFLEFSWLYQFQKVKNHLKSQNI